MFNFTQVRMNYFQSMYCTNEWLLFKHIKDDGFEHLVYASSSAMVDLS